MATVDSTTPRPPTSSAPRPMLSTSLWDTCASLRWNSLTAPSSRASWRPVPWASNGGRPRRDAFPWGGSNVQRMAEDIDEQQAEQWGEEDED